jgi:phosphotransferase system HPr-like phosphotransfer protein
MGLAAEQGTFLVVQVHGPDAPAALEALLELLSTLAVAEVAPDPPLAQKG